MSFVKKYLTLSQIEKKDLLKAWIMISLAFAIAFGGLSFDSRFIATFVVAAITVGIGFLVHEMSHRVLARKYGCWAEFRANNQMLFMAIIFSFFGFIFAAPGAVYIQGHVTKEQNGKISAAGPLSNLVIAGIFLGIFYLNLGSIIQMIAMYGMVINSWLALFNLLPFGFFDGMKVIKWNWRVWGILMALSVFMVFAKGLLFA
jgi:Zn-dependent protease